MSGGKKVQRSGLLRLLPLIFLLTLGGCTGMLTQRMGNTLANAILNQDDPETVRAGAPAYLLLIDGLIADNPRDKSMLLAGARLYSAYASIFVEEGERALRMSQKARDYARRGLCMDYPQICANESAPYDQFVPGLHEIEASGLDALYVYGSAWAGYIQADSANWAAVADLPKVEAVMRRVAAMDEGYDHGRAQLYLAVINTLLPPAMGGRPEVGKAFFERAIALSNGQDLMAKVEYAQRYARMIFNRALHDRLLQDVIDTDTDVPGRVLSNVLAQQKARELLSTSTDYFME